MSMGNESANQEDIEIRLMRELTDIKLQLQRVESLFNNAEMRFKMAIAEHQTHCPMMHKKVLTEGDCYSDWKMCHDRHIKESGKKFDIGYERIKKILVAAGALWIMASTVNWHGILQAVK